MIYILVEIYDTKIQYITTMTFIIDRKGPQRFVL